MKSKKVRNQIKIWTLTSVIMKLQSDIMCLLISLPSDVAEPGGSDLPSAPAKSPPLGPGLSSPDGPPSDWPVLVGKPELLAWSELDEQTEEEKKQIKKNYSLGAIPNCTFWYLFIIMLIRVGLNHQLNFRRQFLGHHFNRFILWHYWTSEF